MLFTSVRFFVFFAVLLILFYLFPRKMRWCVLLTASLVFCWSFNKFLTVHLIAAALLTWYCGKWMALNQLKEKAAVGEIDKTDRETRKVLKARFKKQRKTMTCTSVLLLVLSLLFFKFYNPFAAMMNATGVSLSRIFVPVGISFYTLQLISYLVDVYNQNQIAESNPFRFLLFASWFPLLLEGPIHRYGALAEELRCEKPFVYENFVAGFARVLGGFLKKLILADRLAVLTTALYGNYTEYSGFAVAFAGIAYAVQLYADFSGGIDMAIGFSKMLGITLTENFRRPYFSKSVSEFWRRWHITLGTFLKDYVFYPLTLGKAMSSLSKKLRPNHPKAAKMLPALISMAALWLCSAVWHGEGAQFMLWGFFQWLMVTLDTLFEDRLQAMTDRCNTAAKRVFSFVQTFFTFILISFGEIMFRAENLGAALHMIRALFAKWNIAGFIQITLPALGLDVPDLVVAAIAVVFLFLFEFLQEHEKLTHFSVSVARMPLVFRWLVLLGSIAVLLVFGVYGKGYDPTPFLYFQF